MIDFVDAWHSSNVIICELEDVNVEECLDETSTSDSDSADGKK